MTSLVDMMTILLVFLLQSFSMEGQLITPSRDLKLAESTSRKPPKPALIIEVSSSSVILDGRSIMALSDIDQIDSLFIPVLGDWLSSQTMVTGNTESDREIIIQCDRKTDFKYLKKIMATCARSAYTDFSLLVFQKD